jgi:hypothetical protein
MRKLSFLVVTFCLSAGVLCASFGSVAEAETRIRLPIPGFFGGADFNIGTNRGGAHTSGRGARFDCEVVGRQVICGRREANQGTEDTAKRRVGIGCKWVERKGGERQLVCGVVKKPGKKPHGDNAPTQAEKKPHGDNAPTQAEEKPQDDEAPAQTGEPASDEVADTVPPSSQAPGAPATEAAPRKCAIFSAGMIGGMGCASSTCEKLANGGTLCCCPGAASTPAGPVQMAPGAGTAGVSATRMLKKLDKRSN